ncbi:response regulator transcription factor [Thiococcus pfennigii]|uniref:response regulator transcription factor n=1 Tax=Thiococcus pfennigii TaxID=1057 RepID=UPI001906479C|nr:response regulator [Thiococcus pfennigii]MBK1732294.1 DNA-binding response regulator [Thiococcus pfennigii]
MDERATVFIVDDDPDVRRSLCWLFESLQLPVAAYDSAQAFLGDLAPDQAGCLVLDLRMPGMDGLALLDELRARHAFLPVIMVTGYGTVPTATRAMRSGAVDFIEKPVNHQDLLERVRQALERDRQNRALFGQPQRTAALLGTLTERERQVLDLLVQGLSNKQIARTLKIVVRTVETHRANLMRKLEANSVSALVRMTLLSRSRGY